MPHLNALEFKIVQALIVAADGTIELSKMNLTLLDTGSTRRIADALEKTARIGGSQHNAEVTIRRPEFPVWIDKDLAEHIASGAIKVGVDPGRPGGDYSASVAIWPEHLSDGLASLMVECQDSIRIDKGRPSE